MSDQQKQPEVKKEGSEDRDNGDPVPVDKATSDKVSGDKVTGDKVGGDQIQVGDWEDVAGVAVGRGAMAAQAELGTVIQSQRDIKIGSLNLQQAGPMRRASKWQIVSLPRTPTCTAGLWRTDCGNCS